jgi:hypothetical protein
MECILPGYGFLQIGFREGQYRCQGESESESESESLSKSKACHIRFDPDFDFDFDNIMQEFSSNRGSYCCLVARLSVCVVLKLTRSCLELRFDSEHKTHWM